MTTFLAILGLLTAIAGALTWYLKTRKSPGAQKEEALNASIIKHQTDVRLSITEAEKKAEQGREVADRALAGTLSADELRNLRSGRLPGNG